jgi:hypothetical protein
VSSIALILFAISVLVCEPKLQRSAELAWYVPPGWSGISARLAGTSDVCNAQISSLFSIASTISPSFAEDATNSFYFCALRTLCRDCTS